ncbi:unnamed protein product [Aphanomyces euteiches]|uniref:RxLR effector protein n=1 Tax=Aphanomyces euteiches TaxID=100861 RepID=A0A6G0WDJ5_9STRA|nr:hypothetical protein Ae201684_015997 [Aphanomyces euteiches]KAH9088332.1 hypothetical protein Ae201684P_003026 [Aphanomyces euteiches]KAH9138474.1 hypothetical protein AeRB84_017213 [Aphanomyces euteiches]
MRLVILLALVMTVAVAFARQNQESRALTVVKRKKSFVVKALDAIESFARSKPARIIHGVITKIKARFRKTPPPKRPATPRPVTSGLRPPPPRRGIMIDGQMVGGYLSSGPCCRR